MDNKVFPASVVIYRANTSFLCFAETSDEKQDEI